MDGRRQNDSHDGRKGATTKVRPRRHTLQIPHRRLRQAGPDLTRAPDPPPPAWGVAPRSPVVGDGLGTCGTETACSYVAIWRGRSVDPDGCWRPFGGSGLVPACAVLSVDWFWDGRPDGLCGTAWLPSSYSTAAVDVSAFC